MVDFPESHVWSVEGVFINGRHQQFQWVVGDTSPLEIQKAKSSRRHLKKGNR